MSQSIENLTKALKEHDEAVAKMETLVGRLRRFATPLLENWRDCFVDVSDDPAPIDAGSNGHRIYGQDLPHAAEFHYALANYRTAFNAVAAAWSALSPEEQKLLHRPSFLQTRRSRA